MATLIDNDDDSDKLATSVFNNYCVSGIHIQKKTVKESAYAPTMFDRFEADFGSEHTVSIWAVQQFCEKTNPITPVVIDDSVLK